MSRAEQVRFPQLAVIILAVMGQPGDLALNGLLARKVGPLDNDLEACGVSEQAGIEFGLDYAWRPHDPDAITFGSSETRASLDALAGKMLTAFLNSVQGRVLGVEEEIRGMLVEGVPDLFGRVDLLMEDSDSLVITDIKTSRGKWSQEQVEDSSEQLLLYSHLASEISPGKKIPTRFLVLTKAKEPVIEEHTQEVEPGNVKRTLAGVERVWNAISAGHFYPAPSVVGCAGCGYRAACRAWAG